MSTIYHPVLATPADEIAVASLLQASYATLMPFSYNSSVLDRALPMMTKANPVLLASGTYYIARNHQDLVVGCGGWTMERPGSGAVKPGLAHIRHFATHPDWLGQGVGKSIYAKCKKEAFAAGVKRFECYSSLNAEAFYAALGFSAVRRMDVAMGPDTSFPSVLMEASF